MSFLKQELQDVWDSCLSAREGIPDRLKALAIAKATTVPAASNKRKVADAVAAGSGTLATSTPAAASAGTPAPSKQASPGPATPTVAGAAVDAPTNIAETNAADAADTCEQSETHAADAASKLPEADAMTLAAAATVQTSDTVAERADDPNALAPSNVASGDGMPDDSCNVTPTIVAEADAPPPLVAESLAAEAPRRAQLMHALTVDKHRHSPRTSIDDQGLLEHEVLSKTRNIDYSAKVEAFLASVELDSDVVALGTHHNHVFVRARAYCSHIPRLLSNCFLTYDRLLM